MYNMETNIPKPKCYLVVGEVDYEPHKFKNAKVFLNKEDAENYVSELNQMEKWSPDNTEGVYGYPVIIELDLLLKH